MAPKPYFSWDVIPTPFHGGNKSGVYTDEAPTRRTPPDCLGFKTFMSLLNNSLSQLTQPQSHL